MNKKAYLAPQTEVVIVRTDQQLLTGSHGAESLELPGGEGLTMPSGGILGDDVVDV